MILQVTGAEISVLETVLRCDTERTELLQEEARLLSLMNPPDTKQASDMSDEDQGKSGKKGRRGAAEPDPEASAKLEKVTLK